ncbi:MAG: DUF2851 family protein [Verrucomicrobia bacterium]|nr:DUF2851 family protein [Verrucomicrobiota bacterium]
MRRNQSNFYADWRLRCGVVPVFREDHERPPERLLQAVWFHQRLHRDQLQTVDGRVLQVLHPGFWNREAGPDFRDAVLRLGGEPAVSGDVEVDLTAGGWTAHGHDRNPDFRRVVLHVVWEPVERPPRPTLCLQSCLDSSLGELSFWLGTEAAHDPPAVLTGQCCLPLRDLDDAQVRALLLQAALVRLQSKAARLQTRAREAGWAQALWEALFRALGYKQNAWPMQRLAELKPRLCPADTPPDPHALQARLLGAAGLLPADVRGRQPASVYVRGLWDEWWRERDTFAPWALPPSVWRLGGLRPANHPQRRLALAAHWWSRGDLPRRIEHWCLARFKDSELARALLEQCDVGNDPFWSHHWTLRSPRLPAGRPLLGPSRLTDLALNAILPWLWIRATDGRSDTAAREIERRYLAWPAAQDNAALRLARQRLFASTPPRRFRGAAPQQGTLQIVRDFCEHANALCEGCRFPQLVREWVRSAGATT